jgi:hypothetical protein
MGLFNKEQAKSKLVDFGKEQIKDEIKGQVEEKVKEVVVDKTLNYALENAGSSFLPWWLTIMWWPIKQLALLITWPIRVLFKKKK